jgi:arginase
VIAVPYHLGRRDVEVGLGPTRVLESIHRECTVVERASRTVAELDAVMDVNRELSRAVAAHAGPPIVLAGNCGSCIGTISGLTIRPGIVWFDAHGDFNTPETTISGALEGMSLAIATGSCHHHMMPSPVVERDVLLAATRSLDPLEADRLRRSEINVVSLASLPAALESLAQRVDGVYMHIDLDVLDPAESPGVNFSEPGGISAEALYDAVRTIGASVPIAAAAIANFNPARDREGRTLRIALRLIDILSQTQSLR